jgi:two-component system chemotaxis response regulator CheY
MNYDAPILIVDDQPIVIDLTKRFLSRLKFRRVHWTLDGDKALTMLRQAEYQLVISDMNMRPRTGIHLLRALRADPNLREIRFLLMTASVEFGVVKEAKQNGADAYLLKPFTRIQLQAKLEEVFASKPPVRS